MNAGVIKCHEEDSGIRLTFNWPSGIEQVYIFATRGNFDIRQASLGDGKLFTLQEYKKRGGCMMPKKPGVFTYYICPFLRENAEDIFADGMLQATHTCRINIDYTIRQRIGRYKNHEITMLADYPVARGIVKYEKEPGGVEYIFGEIPGPGRPVIRIARTAADESLRFFISEEFSELYNLRDS
ncbi:MAG: hypothetical protein FWB91_14410 [Defluviitaleaceae bacterium]|nr:hypothetical protein [Defluviitaleaceae bacterium]